MVEDALAHYRMSLEGTERMSECATPPRQSHCKGRSDTLSVIVLLLLYLYVCAHVCVCLRFLRYLEQYPETGAVLDVVQLREALVAAEADRWRSLRAKLVCSFCCLLFILLS